MKKKRNIIILTIGLIIIGLIVFSINIRNNKINENILMYDTIQFPLDSTNNLNKTKLAKLIIKNIDDYELKDLTIDLEEKTKNKQGTIRLTDIKNKKEIVKKFNYSVIEKEEETNRDSVSNKKTKPKTNNSKTEVIKEIQKNENNDDKKSENNIKKEPISKQSKEKQELSYNWKEEKYGDIKIERKADPNRFTSDPEKLIQDGELGLQSVQYKIIKENGKIISESKTGEVKNISNPKPKIISYGTKKKEGYIDHQKSKDLFKQINAYRASQGLKPFIWDSDTAPYTQIRAKEISTYNSHWRPNQEYFDNDDYNLVSEIITDFGFPTPQRAVDAWKASQSHHNELLATNFEHASTAAYVDENNNIFWIMHGVYKD